MAADRTPLEVLIDAKLSGTSHKYDFADEDGNDVWGYRFRTNEQAAQLAIDALLEAGYAIERLNVSSPDEWTGDARDPGPIVDELAWEWDVVRDRIRRDREIG